MGLRSTQFYHFADISKMIRNLILTVYAGIFSFLYHINKLFHLVFSNSVANSLADQYSIPLSLVIFAFKNVLFELGNLVHVILLIFKFASFFHRVQSAPV